MLSPLADAALLGVLGLLVGSFLNVVIHRLPRMLERQWAAECAGLAGRKPEPAPEFNLVRPRSRCPHCGHQIRWYENVPVVSWLALRGRCSACKGRISARYPLVELATAGLFAFCGWKFGGIAPAALAWSGFAAALVALALIDWDTQLLPDDITLPLVWAGLVAAALRWTNLPLTQALWGAVAGYLSLWLVYHGFRLLTGKEGMGYGDFKLFGALGAWFGWQALVPMILLASAIGAVVGIGLKLRDRLGEGGAMPFGPFLAGAGLAALLFGPAVLLEAIGL